MKIWIVNPFDDPPDEAVPRGRYWSLAEALIARGHSVTWWTADWSHRFKRPRGVGRAARDLKVRRVPVRPYLRNVGRTRLKSHADFAQGFEERATALLVESAAEAPLVVLASLPTIDGALAAKRVADTVHAKFIVDVQDLWPETFYQTLPVPRFMREWLGRRIFARLHLDADSVLTRADGVTAVCDTYIAHARTRGALGPFHRTYIGFNAEPGLDREKADGPMRFVYIGSLSRNYDWRTLLDAVAILHAEGADFEVHVAGSGEATKAFRKRAEDPVVMGSRFKWHGFLAKDALRELLGDAEVGLNLIRPESRIVMPNKLSDYLGHNLPVINSLPGEPEHLLGAAGWRYVAGDPASLVAAMRHCVKSRRAVREAAGAALRLGEMEFNRANTYPALAEFIESIA
ncbi:MAG TPA: glycosyltransferase family 4 protein [Opitutaceae bacterium]|nr:glycosyltransferase family 4 protein [Opitutaceae bacterium]